MWALPAGVPEVGTLTLLFTDLVGSTPSLVAIGEDRYDSVRDEHDLLVGGTIAARHGEIVKLLAHELIGKLSLGIDPDDPQRWG